jgi:hypothetical protein
MTAQTLFNDGTTSVEEFHRYIIRRDYGVDVEEVPAFVAVVRGELAGNALARFVDWDAEQRWLEEWS